MTVSVRFSGAIRAAVLLAMLAVGAGADIGSVPASSGYVSLRTMAGAVGAKVWVVGDRFIVVYRDSSLFRNDSLARSGDERECVFAAGQDVAVCNGRRLWLGAVCRLAEGGADLLVPATAAAGLFAGAEAPMLVSAERFQRRDTTVVRLSLNQGARIDPGFVMPGRSNSSLEFRLEIGATCDSGFDAGLRLISLTSGTGLLREVVRESAAAISLLFTFRQPAAESVVLRAGAIEVWAWPKPARRVSRVLLDPGHGGRDPGAVGRLGTEEKRLVLDIASRLKRRLESEGIQVNLTRECDTFVSLAERVRLANGAGFDFFVSIHVNAAPNRKACGLETYFLSEARTDWERAVAARENASFEPELMSSPQIRDQLGLILADLAQNEFLFESSELAGHIQEATLRATRMNDRGVKQAGFYVLRGCFMPAVLVECGFVSNRSEEKLLRRGEFREKLAKGIADGCLAFVRAYERRLNGHRP
ncbi:MAG: N-acetylmuramoyl-L-alanine amidase [candidate division WOR-3 bacterium]